MSINIYYHRIDYSVLNIVTAAFTRSFTASQVKNIPYPCQSQNAGLNHPEVAVCINPQDADAPWIITLLKAGRKVILLGRLSILLAKEFNISIESLPPEWAAYAYPESRALDQFDASPFEVVYDTQHILGRASGCSQRFFSRFDFTDEWNTHAYGKITLDGSCWSLAQLAESSDVTAIARCHSSKLDFTCLYVTLLETQDSALLWYNRAVGPVDSVEWRLIEEFCSHYRYEELVCLPKVDEIPYGFSGAVTMRLDCDQAISSARSLYELYSDYNLPLSLALVTGLPLTLEDCAFVEDVLANGGSVVSHSHSHPVNWGGTYLACLREALVSRSNLIEKGWLTTDATFAVSPFHQNPDYAVRALADAGYQGFVAGIIHNDPNFLMGRSGIIPLNRHSLISHSQQCMLHGDTYHRYGNSVKPYLESYCNHMQGQSIFGYLDHPFSEEYQYGWDSEDERLNAHEELIQAINQFEGVWWASLRDCLNFLYQRSQIQIALNDNGQLETLVPNSFNFPQYQISWGNVKILL